MQSKLAPFFYSPIPSQAAFNREKGPVDHVTSDGGDGPALQERSVVVKETTSGRDDAESKSTLAW